MATRKPAKKPAPAPKKTTKTPAARKKAAGVAAPAQKRAATKPKTPAKAAPQKQTRKAAAPAAAPAPAAAAPLTDKQQRFVDEYLVDLNATQAYMRAFPGVKATTASTEGTRLLGNPWIAEAIAKARQALQERTQITADRVVQELALIATADPRELVEHIVGSCRHCHGEGFKFQRTIAEFNHDQAKALDKGENPAEFDHKGGIGFDPHKAPHPLCPECMGRGQGRTFIGDTRRLSPAALALFAGVKETKDGFEVKMHSKMDALEKLAKHLGAYAKDNEQQTETHQLTKELTDVERAVRLLHLLKTNPAALAGIAGGAKP